jgi:hypothetical protein
VVRFGYDGLLVRRHKEILPARRPTGTASHQDRNRSTTQRVGRTETCKRIRPYGVSASRRNYAVLPARRPLRTGGSSILPRVLSVPRVRLNPPSIRRLLRQVPSYPIRCGRREDHSCYIDTISECEDVGVAMDNSPNRIRRS